MLDAATTYCLPVTSKGSAMKITFNFRQKQCLVITCFPVFAACSTKSVSSATPAPTPVHQREPTIEENRWSPQLATGAHQYLINDSSMVSITNDTTIQPLPIISTSIYSIAIAKGGQSFTMIGRVDSSMLSSSLHTKNSADSTQSTEFKAFLSELNRMTSLPKQLVTCAQGSNPAMTRVFDLIISYPTSDAKVGDKWTDTISTTTCHGKTLLLQTTVREFRLLAFTPWKQRDAVQLQRSNTMMFSSLSEKPDDHLTASGSGSGSAVIYAERRTGFLLQSDGTSQTKLTISTTRGTFPFTQSTNTHIQLK